MIKFRIILLLLGILFSPLHSQAQSSEAYFAKLTGIISPYLAYKPRGAIQKEQANQIAHYQVKYDAQNRISELGYYRGIYPSNGAYYGTHKVSYSYEKDKIIRSYFDNQGEPGHTWRHYYLGGNIHQEVFSLDAQGNKTRMILLDTLGNRVETGLGAYEFVWETLDEKSFIQKQYTQAGEAVYLTTYFPFPTSLITVDERGHLYSITNIEETSQKIQMQTEAGFAQVIFNFDKYGNELGWRFYDHQGELANRKAFEDMDYGYAQWIGKMKFYDRKLGLEKFLKEYYLDKDGKPVENNLSIHEVHYHVDQLDNLIELKYYNKDHQKQMHPSQGFFRVVMQYNSKGELSQTIRYNTKGEVIK